MARREIPWVVGLAERLVVRLNNETAGTLASASSSRIDRSSADPSSRTTENAASPAAGGKRAAVTTTSSTETG